MTSADVLMAVVVAIFGSGGFWAYLQHRSDQRAKKKKSTNEDIMNALNELSVNMEINTEITVANARDRLNHLNNTFIKIGHIPIENYASYKALGEAYCKKYNSEVKAKFEWCINNLEVK